MKKLLPLFLVFVLLFALCSCSSDAGSITGGSDSGKTDGIETAAQTLEQEIEAPEGVIEASDSVAEPDDFVGLWINPLTGDLLDVSAGTLDPNTGIVKGNTEFKPRPADHSLHSWSNPSYKLEGDILTLGEERFRAEKENDKLYLNSLDSATTYIRRDDFYRFEDIEIHQIGDTVSTDAMEFTLNGYGYCNEVDPLALGGNVSLFHEDMFVPDNGMVWATVSYKLLNVSNQTIAMDCANTNVRFYIVYRDSFTFDMDSNNHNFITKGYGGDSHVEWLGSSSDTLELAPLVSENYDTWLPVAAAVQEDATAPIHILVLLPASSGTQLFAYDLSSDSQPVGDSESADAPACEGGDLYGTWQVTEINTSSGPLSVAEMEEKNVYSWSDWSIVLSETGELYLQTNNTSVRGPASIDGETITAGKNQWMLRDGRLSLTSGNTEIFYEKVSDSQEFPEIEKQALAELLNGTWDFDSDTRTGYFTFSGNTASSVINDVIIEAASVSILMNKNQINLSLTSETDGLHISMDLSYSLDGGDLSLSYSGDTLIKR